MKSHLPKVAVIIGTDTLVARLRTDLAPQSCDYLLSVIPYKGNLIHARWSGEAMWCPLDKLVKPGFALPSENARHRAQPGEVLLYIGQKSEPELLFPYGECRFASVAGELMGIPVLQFDSNIEALSRIGRDVLWRGATELQISLPTEGA